MPVVGLRARAGGVNEGRGGRKEGRGPTIQTQYLLMERIKQGRSAQNQIEQFGIWD